MPGSWLVSARVTEGRYARDEFGEDLLIRLVNASAHQASWKTSGDGWNGAFHIKARLHPYRGRIHNHAGRDSDVRYGWSGFVFLDLKANMRSHQSWLELWAMRDSGRVWDTHPYYGGRSNET